MTGQPIHAMTAVWGAWHLAAFLDLALPTLLEPGNLPALVERHPFSWRIWTRAEDKARIEAALAYKRLAALLPVSVSVIPSEVSADPIEAHLQLWEHGIAAAAETDALAFLISPDLIWSAGSLGHLADLIAAGKRAICAVFPRVPAEAAIPTLRRMVGPCGVASLSARELLGMCLEDCHPLMRAYRRDSQNFPRHPEMVLWPVAGGVAVRALAREVMLFDANRVRLNGAMLPHAIDPAEFHMIGDSDDLFGVSLAPSDQDADWSARARTFSPLTAAFWWLHYDSPANDLVARTAVRWHDGTVPQGGWDAVEAEGGTLIEGLIAKRETMRRMWA